MLCTEYVPTDRRRRKIGADVEQGPRRKHAKYYFPAGLISFHVGARVVQIELERAPAFPQTKMAHKGSHKGRCTAHPLENAINNRKPVATAFPRLACEAIADASSAAVVDDQ